jgi:hypothetical protein
VRLDSINSVYVTARTGCSVETAGGEEGPGAFARRQALVGVLFHTLVKSENDLVRRAGTVQRM